MEHPDDTAAAVLALLADGLPPRDAHEATAQAADLQHEAP